MVGVPTPETLRRQYHSMRDLLARYRLHPRRSSAVSGEVRRHSARCCGPTPTRSSRFADVAAIKQANDELAGGAPFRAVARSLMASRHGQLAFDFRLDAAPAKILTLRRPAVEPGRSRRTARTRTTPAIQVARRGVLPGGLGARRRRRGEAGAGGRGLPQGAGARSVSRRRAHQSRQHPLQPRRARRGAGALRARDRPRVGLLRGALQPRQHLPRPRPLRRGAGVLPAKRSASIPTTPTRTSIWRSRSKRWGCRRRRGRTGGPTGSSRRTASGWSWRRSSRSSAAGSLDR